MRHDSNTSLKERSSSRKRVSNMAKVAIEKNSHGMESFYDAKFSIEELQHEPYENGFTWRTVLGAFFIAFVMLPGVIFMGLMIGADLGTAADWVTVILFVELARRSFITLRKQELYILKYAVGQLSHTWGGVALAGGMFASLIWNGYLRNSEAFHNFGIAQQVPDWFAPYGDAVKTSFLSQYWMPVVGVIIISMLLSKFSQLSLGFLIYKITSDVEKLPFPLAPIHAEGAIALAESSSDTAKGGYRQYCFSIGIMIGAVFGILYVAIPTLSMAFLNKSIMLIPIPFWDWTKSLENILPTATIGLALNLGLIFTGFVLPWRIALGSFITTMVFQLILNPFVFFRLGLLPSWKPGKDALETQITNSLDMYLSVGIGAAFAILTVGVFYMVRGLINYSKSKGKDTSMMDVSLFWKRDVERGDPPTWLALSVWFISSCIFVAFSNYLINGSLMPNETHFSIWFLVVFAFVFTPLNSYINARMIGIAGQGASIPYLREGAIFSSHYRATNIWFAPMPLGDVGGMSSFLRETQLTRTKFTSILKVELLIVPLMMVASFFFWTYISGLGPIPSDSYPYVQKFWPQMSQMQAVWTSSNQEGQSLLLKSIKPVIIGSSYLGIVGTFIGFGFAGISAQFIYGGLGGMSGFPHYAIIIFIGACLGRFVLAKRFGADKWQNYAPILAVGFGAGMGLVGMLAIAINFLWVSIGNGQ